MANLFDIAGLLVQYDEGGGGGGAVAGRNRWGPTNNQDAELSRRHSTSSSISTTATNDTALFILDETLKTLYDARRPSAPVATVINTTPASLGSARCKPNAEESPRSASGSNQRDQRASYAARPSPPPQSLPSSTSRTLASQPLRQVFAQSVSYPRLPTGDPPPPPLPKDLPTQRVDPPEQQADPDMVAKTALREVGDEIEQIPIDGGKIPAVQRLWPPYK